jgi:MFS family permease
MLLCCFMSVGAVAFTPAYPALAKEFDLSSTETQWVMTLFLLGTAFGRLPYGPVANRIGRKKTLYLGLGISIAGTITTIYAPTYLWLCLGRLIQAMGSSVTLKISYTMIGDVHTGAKATQVLSYAMLAYAILPGIATSITGFFTPRYGWRGGFWLFLAFTIFVMASCTLLSETSKERDPSALKIKKIAVGYFKQLRNLYLVTWGLLMGLSTAVIFIFAQEAPFIAIDLMGLSPAQYGVFYLVPAFGIAAGSLATAWLAGRVNSMKGMLLGILIILFSSLGMGALFLGSWVNAWALFMPQVAIQFGDALLYTNASSVALSESTDKSNASAVMLFVNSVIGFLGTYIVGSFFTRSSLIAHKGYPLSSSLFS